LIDNVRIYNYDENGFFSAKPGGFAGSEGNRMKKVGIVMGSDSDLPVIKKATDMLNSLDIPWEAHVYSAHRTPVEARDFALQAREKGFGVLIAAAGMAAHLAGAVAANTTLPVIGIPCQGPCLEGLDALLSTVQMPTGIPVATVAVNGGANAALLAAQILAVEDADLAAKLNAKRKADAEAVLAKDAGILERINA
jgi:5-(carboxyamino)imidazole ribonucleotide mutase